MRVGWVVCACFIQAAVAAISIDTHTAKALQKDSLVEVTVDGLTKTENIAKRYYMISIKSRKKHSTYDQINAKVNKIKRLLKKRKLIPNDASLVMMMLKPEYMKRKKSWTISALFVVFGTNHELDGCQAAILKIGATKEAPFSQITFLKEKIVASEYFMVAKYRVNNWLRCDTKKNYKIQSVKDIQISGFSDNSDTIEDQLLGEFNCEEKQNCQKLKQDGQREKSFKMTVIFEIGEDRKEQNTSQVSSESSSNSSEANSENRSMESHSSKSEL